MLQFYSIMSGRLILNSHKNCIDNNFEHHMYKIQIFTDINKTYKSLVRKIFQNILIEFGAPTKLGVFRLINIFLNETCSKIRTGKHCQIRFLCQMI
jgi:hypothetical protein